MYKASQFLYTKKYLKYLKINYKANNLFTPGFWG